MNRDEISQLKARLAELAEYYGHKPPSTAALKIWADCLGGVSWPDVATALTDWPKTQRAFPSGQEIRKVAASLLSDRLEAESKRNATFAPTVDKLVETAQDTPNARAFKRMWKAWKSRKVSSPREWCVNVLASDKADAELKAFAAASLAGMGDEKPARGRYWYEET